MPPPQPSLFEHPPSVKSGQPLRSKVVVTHRSDILLEEQVTNVKTIQDQLQRALMELDVCRGGENAGYLEQQVEDLQDRNEQMLIVLKVMQKINVELIYARAELKKALASGGNVTAARKRISWLDDRLENLLGKKRKRSPVRGEMKSHATGGTNLRQGSLLSMGDMKASEFSDLSSMGDMDQSGMSSSGSPINTHRSRSLVIDPLGTDLPAVVPIPEARETETPAVRSTPPPPKLSQEERERTRQERKDEKKRIKKEKKRQLKREEWERQKLEDKGLTSKEKSNLTAAELGIQVVGEDEEREDKKSVKSVALSVPGTDGTFVTQPGVSDSPDFQEVRSGTVLSAPPESHVGSHVESVPLSTQKSSMSDQPPPLIMGITISKPEDEDGEPDEEDEGQSEGDLESGSEGVEGPVGQETDDSMSDVSSVSTDTETDSLADTRTFLTEMSAKSGDDPERGSRRSRGSRVTIRSPDELPDLFEEIPPEDFDAGQNYWNSEHHRFDFSENIGALLEVDPLSYHLMGLAVPGSFVKDANGTGDTLPWRPKSPGSDISDIHSRALDRLHTHMHKMYDKVKDAALVSVRDTKDKQNTILNNVQRQTTFMQDRRIRSSSSKPSTSVTSKQVEARSADDGTSVISKPTLAKFGLGRRNSEESVAFPALGKDRLGSSLSGRLVYYPNPLPYPEKLPLTRTNRSVEFPRTSDAYGSSKPGVDKPAERIVDQRNLLNETKFTSSLFRSKAPVRKVAATSSEERFKKMLKEERQKTATTLQSGKRSQNSKTPVTPQKTLPNIKSTFRGAKAMMKFKDEEPTSKRKIKKIKKPPKCSSPAGLSSWNDMKPKSGALDHSGLKWERVKMIVHNGMVSKSSNERADAARQLGSLKCGDPMVTFALRDRLKHDDDDRVIYECTKALLKLGNWEDEVLGLLVHYLLSGNRDIKADILKSIINGKNVQYIDKRLPTFPELTRTLSLLCKSGDPDDVISFSAAVAIGKLCVQDENATDKLNIVLHGCKDNHKKAEALEILVRQMNQSDWATVECILKQLQKSPVWKYRKEAARHLIHLGKRRVCKDGGQVAEIYDILERRLWDDPNKNVRLEVAKALAALELFAQACERVEKKLEDPIEESRAQAVISIGTLGMKSERIYRALLEMLELDSSEYVRLMILRTFATLNSQDKRVMRVLRDKEKGDGVLAREANKTLDILSKEGSKPVTRAGGRK